MYYIVILAFFAVLVRAEQPLDNGYGAFGGHQGFSPQPHHPGHHGGLGPSIGGPQFPGPQAPIIHKHVYVHVPPPEPFFPRIKKPLPPPPPPQKHYKIIFIKAPTPPPVELPEVPLIPPAPEVKTLVYVLTKRPEPLPELSIPVPPPPAQHKPEVFFIRYKTPGLDFGGQRGGGLGVSLDVPLTNPGIGQDAAYGGGGGGFDATGKGQDGGHGHGGHGGQDYI